ncbi:MAG: hypothetical protein CVV42_02555 [Candidatus Riflebacteria bacterium HGW-Riflebacteria-2]|jgi:hypothetical protein|nr:MAG: hypothetical protein CVV42_02555 [Candidatus Riflebacteria bacterium HGW-Riflebacteria-2]
MKKVAVTVFLLIMAVGGYCMIETLSLEELANRSDVIAMVDVVGVKAVGRLPSKVEVIANLVKVNEPFKGEVAVGENLKIKTWRGIEDNPDLVKGSRVLLFLQRNDNHYIVVNGLQGWWPLDKDGKFMAMGTGKTIEEVKKAIENPPPALPTRPKISL